MIELAGPMTAPTEKEFRDAGYTADAINYPLSISAFEALCAWNGAAPQNAPRAWRYAPNKRLQEFWEGVARKRALATLHAEEKRLGLP